MAYLQLIRQQRPTVAFGVLHAASSGFGQTFFVSLFVPALMERHGLGRASFSSVYAAATLCSSLLLPFAGRGIDLWPAGRYAAAVAVGLSLACLTVAGASGPITLFAGLLMLRLFGQGLMGHTASTVVARHFHKSRGSALSLSSLGYPLSEMSFPFLATLSLASIGPTGTLLACAATIIVVTLPMGQWLLRAGAAPEPDDGLGTRRSRRARDWTRADVLRSPAALCLTPLFNIQAFALTGLFFHQLALAESKGWSATLLATSFVAFGACRATGSFLVGPLIDRFGAGRVLGLGLLPFTLGLGLLAASDRGFVAAVYLAGAGLSAGAMGSASTAFQAEVFGLAHLGAIKSFFTMTAVLSTAAAPPLFGYWLESGGDFQHLVLACLAGTISAGAVGAWSLRRLGQPHPSPAAPPI